VSYLIIAANLLVFAVELALSRGLQPTDAVLSQFAGYWPDLGKSRFWGGVFLSMFSHASPDHILGNLSFFLVFAPKVEAAFDAHIDDGRMGHMGFLCFYLMGGVVAAGFQGLSGGLYEGFIGASGAIAFVLGAFWFMFPEAKIQFQGKQIGAFYYLGTWFLVQALLDLTGSGGGVAYGAHVGGFVFGVVVAWGSSHVRFSTSAFGLLEVPEKLSLQEEIDAAEAVLGGDTPQSVSG
jgi:membrane associated rhomboid family serine protease